MSKNIQRAYFAGGCFWGVEYYFQKVDGVISTRVGFMGGDKINPSYEEVSRGDTGHVETVEVVFDRDKVSFKDLTKTFFEIHDPTQKNRQGPDIGEQYRSMIFYTSDAQKIEAEKLIELLKGKGFKIATELRKVGRFWEAEAYHQNYYDKKGGEPYCHIRSRKF